RDQRNAPLARKCSARGEPRPIGAAIEHRCRETHALRRSFAQPRKQNLLFGRVAALVLSGGLARNTSPHWGEVGSRRRPGEGRAAEGCGGGGGRSFRLRTARSPSPPPSPLRGEGGDCGAPFPYSPNAAFRVARSITMSSRPAVCSIRSSR